MTQSRRLFRALTVTMLVLGSLGAASVASAHIRVDPNDQQAVDSFLVSIGLDPAEVAFVDGSKVYVGPDCPGADWTCATVGVLPTVQLGDEANVFECTGTAGPNSCTVVQIATTADNSAVCRITSSDPNAQQSCSITQTNDSGANDALIQLTVLATKATTAGSGQDAAVVQSNGSGSNSLTSRQDLSQDVSGTSLGGLVLTGDSRQTINAEQDSLEGANLANVAQLLNQRSHGDGGDITQRQNAADEGFDLQAIVDQESTSGNNDIQVAQRWDAQQDGSSVFGAIDQLQGNPNGGIKADVDNRSTAGGFSNYDVDQTKVWSQVADTLGSELQVQHDVELCCIVTVPHTPNTCTVDQVADMSQTPGGSSTIGQHVSASAKDNCSSHQQAETADGQTAVNDESGTRIDAHQECDETGCTSVSNPVSASHMAVRDVSDGEQFTGDEAPNFTTADPSEIIEYKLTYHNHAAGTATGVTVATVVPASSTFLSCSDGCTTSGDGGPGTTVAWAIGTITGESARAVTYQVVLDETYTVSVAMITSSSTWDNDQEAGGSSNETTVKVIAGPDSELHKAVRNVTTGGSFALVANAKPGQVLEYQLTYHNHGKGPASDILITDPVPANTTFVSCQGCSKSGTKAGSSISFSRGTGEAGGVRVVTFRVKVNNGTQVGTLINNVGTVDTGEEAPKTSNQCTVTVV